jgi:hypothetical protein
MTLRERGSVLEVRRGAVRVLRCLAHPGTLDDLAVPAEARAYRVARDELLLIDGPADVDLPGGLVVDETGGWAALTLAGEDAREAFGRLSALPVEPGWLQGVVAGVPAKAFVDGTEIQLLVAGSHAHHVDERVRAACSDLLAS